MAEAQKIKVAGARILRARKTQQHCRPVNGMHMDRGQSVVLRLHTPFAALQPGGAQGAARTKRACASCVPASARGYTLPRVNACPDLVLL